MKQDPALITLLDQLDQEAYNGLIQAIFEKMSLNSLKMLVLATNDEERLFAQAYAKITSDFRRFLEAEERQRKAKRPK